MNWVEVWNELSYFDGMVFSVWLAGMYYLKRMIDWRFK